MVRESSHFIKTRDIQAFILKMDLIKTYDRVDWTFLCFVHIYIDLLVEVTNWIMACMTSTTFSILVNGSPTYFLSCSRGLRQGCPLFPLLFLLIIEGINRLIDYSKQEKKIKGIIISHSLFITCLLFINDVLIFGRGFVMSRF